MDDPKAPSSLDDLVKELSRPQNVPPSNLPRPVSPSLSGPAVPSAVAPKPQEYQSSIRTMKDDISKVASGGKVSGTTIPRKIEPTPTPMPTPQPAVPPLPAPIQKPVSMAPPKPSSPIPSFKAPIPLAPKPQPQSQTQFQPPVPPILKIPEMPASSGRRPTALIFTAIAGVAVLGGFFYWFLVLRNNNQPVAVESPTPVATATETPIPTPVVTLANIFPDSAGAINLSASGNPKKDFNSQLANQFSVEGGKFQRLQVNSGPSYLAVTQLFDRFLITYPADLKLGLASESAILIYGQKEAFNTKGLPLASPTPNSKRLVLITEISDQQIVSNSLKNWESAMTENLASLFNIQTAKNKTGFLDNFYQGVSIRYRNFAYPDNSVDYAIVPASNGKSYLVFTNSREAMFSTISQMSLKPL